MCVCVCGQRGEKVFYTGYWGDIVSSPYLSFGIETDDKSLLKTQNGLHVKVKHTVAKTQVTRYVIVMSPHPFTAQ